MGKKSQIIMVIIFKLSLLLKGVQLLKPNIILIVYARLVEIIGRATETFHLEIFDMFAQDAKLMLKSQQIKSAQNAKKN